MTKTKEEISSVRKFMLNRFPTDEYMDCPVPKEYWPIMQEYSDQENERLKAVVSKQDELGKLRKSYIVFIGEQLSDHAEFLRIHGISCSEKDIKTGIEYRKQIEHFESELSKLKAE